MRMRKDFLEGRNIVGNTWIVDCLFVVLKDAESCRLIW